MIRQNGGFPSLPVPQSPLRQSVPSHVLLCGMCRRVRFFGQIRWSLSPEFFVGRSGGGRSFCQIKMRKRETAGWRKGREGARAYANYREGY